MAKNNKICVCCTKAYSYCPHCSADDSKPSWMNMFCSEDCKNLFQAATDYYAGELTKEKAKEIVKNADLSNKSNFKTSIVKFINELTEEDKKGVVEVSTIETKLEKVDIPKSEPNSFEEVKKEVVVEKKTAQKNKKKYFKN